MLAKEYLDGFMKSNRKGRFMTTYTGIRFWPLDPREDEIDIRDIAHSLSLQCRFNGHIKKFYSVGEHSIRVASECKEENRLCGLLHDASEAYLCDIPTPLKMEMPDYLKYEKQLQDMIYNMYGIKEEPEDVRWADKVLLVTEMRDLRLNVPLGDFEYKPLKSEIVEPWTPKIAEQMFLNMFN